jgi:hypothetical protein
VPSLRSLCRNCVAPLARDDFVALVPTAAVG